MSFNIFTICSLYTSLVLVSIYYSKASSIYGRSRNVNLTNSHEDRTESLTGFSFNNEDDLQAETCEHFGEMECKAIGRLCMNKENGFTCEKCMENFQDENGKCKPNETCGKRGDDVCRSVFKKCEKRVNDNYLCGDCLESYIRDVDGNCVFEKCNHGGDEFCKNIGKNCVDKAMKSGNQSQPGYVCDTCLDGYQVDPNDKNICAVDQCAWWNGYYWCGEKGRNCTSTKNSYVCEGCKTGYIIQKDGSGNCVKDTCENGGSEHCKKFGKTCIDNEDGLRFNCGECLEHFRQDFRNEEICVPDTCVNFGQDHCAKGLMTCTDMDSGLGYICDDCFENYRKENISGYCVEETCERFGERECKAIGRLCMNKENGFGFTCEKCMENFQDENGKCKPKTCASNGESECKKYNRVCVDQYPAGYICGKCGHGFTEIEGSDICIEDFCLSSPCKNNGICKAGNGSFVCFCKHPFCGKTCEVEINPPTSFPVNISTPTPDLKTTSNNSIATTLENFNLTTYLPSTSQPSNFSRDYNLTTVDRLSTPLSTTSIGVNTTTMSPVNKTTIDVNETTVSEMTTGTVTSSEKPCTSDRGLKIIFKNDYTIRNLTEVVIKT